MLQSKLSSLQWIEIWNNKTSHSALGMKSMNHLDLKMPIAKLT